MESTIEGKKVLLVEPHPDDVCLSMFHFLFKIQANYWLTNVFWNGKRSSKLFCERLGINYVESDPVEDLHNKPNRIPPSEIMKSSDAFELERTYYYQHFPHRYMDVRLAVLEAFLKVKPEVVITALGLLHPFHVLVSSVCQDLIGDRDIKLIYWGDFPYAARKYGQKIIADFGVKPVRFHDGANRNLKIKVFEECYPTEIAILRWDRNFIMDGVEYLFLT